MTRIESRTTPTPSGLAPEAKPATKTTAAEASAKSAAPTPKLAADTMVQAQASKGAAKGADATAQAFAVRESRRAKSNGTVSFAGVKMQRLAPKPTPLNEVGEKIMDAALKIGAAPPPEMLGWKDWRTGAVASTAVHTPLVKGADPKNPLFGDLSIIRPGLSNLHPSPALVFRAAQYSGKVVMAYPNMSDSKTNKLREATEIDGVPVPPELKGKVFVIGSPEHNMLSYKQYSDIFVQQLEAMRKDQGKLGVDMLSAKATVIGHSQGCLDSALTRERLEKAGFKDVIGRVVALAPPFRGSGFGDDFLGTIAGGVSSVVDPDDAFNAIRELDPDRVKATLTEDKQKYVDLTLAGAVGRRPGIYPKIGFPPFDLEGHHNIRPILRGLAGGLSVADTVTGDNSVFSLLRMLANGSYNSDGLVSTQSAHYGKQYALLDHPYDHAGIFEDPAVIDEIAKRLV